MSEVEATEVAEPSIDQIIQAAQAKADAYEAANPPPAFDTEETPAETAPDTEREPEAVTDPVKLKELKKLAQSLGLEVEDGKILTPERVKFRQERRAKENAIEAKAAELEQRFETAVSNLEKQYGPLADLKAAFDADDYDAIAKLKGFKNFGEMTQEYVLSHNNPERKRIREIERKQAELEARERSLLEQQEQSVRQQEESQKRQEYKAHVVETLSAYEDDPLVAKCAKELPGFVDAVVAEQEKSWNPKTRSYVPFEEAAQILVDKLRVEHERLGKIIGAQGPNPEKQPATRVIGEQRPVRRAPTTVSQTAAAEASSSMAIAEDDPDFDKKWRAKWSGKFSASP